MKNLKHAVLRGVAAVICRVPVLKPLRQHLLHQWRFAGLRPTNRLVVVLFHHVLAYWIEHVWLPEPDPDRRETLKREIMGRRSEEWVATYAHQPLVEGPARLLTLLDTSLEASPPALVVEIGAGSGKDIAWLAARHPRHTFIGTELFAAGVAYAERTFRMANLSYRAIDALAALEILRESGTTRRYCFVNGVLNYMQPEHVARLLAELAKIGRLDVLICEPYHGAPDVPGSRFRGNFSWTHAYRRYAEAAGFTTRSFESREQVFYWGTTERMPTSA